MTRDPIHPGETLREDLDTLGTSAAELAMARSVWLRLRSADSTATGARANLLHAAVRVEPIPACPARPGPVTLFVSVGVCPPGWLGPTVGRGQVGRPHRWPDGASRPTPVAARISARNRAP